MSERNDFDRAVAIVEAMIAKQLVFPAELEWLARFLKGQRERRLGEKAPREP